MQVSTRQYAQAWYEALQEADEKDRAEISQKMMKKLQTEGKLSLLMRIVKEVKRLGDEDLGVQHVKVRSAHLIDEKELEQLLAGLLDTKKLAISQKQDKALVGGIVLETADQRWDLSIKNQLNQLKKSLSQ